jgi:outer membrane immunogenic protein
MRKLLLTGAAFAALAGQAFAADLPARPVYKAPPPAPVYGWTGFYGGVNLGYSWGKLSNDFTVNTIATTFSEGQQVNGVIGGFQWGYNWQFGNWVLGTESDFMFSDQRGSTNYCLNGGCTVYSTGSHRLPWLGTGRTRLGLLATPNILLYGTGGVAYGQIRSDYSVTSTVIPPVGTSTLSLRDTRVGWVVGAGIEGMVAPNWLLRAEYLYVDLGNDRVTLTDTTGAVVFTQNRRFNDSIARAALSYKFGGL